MDALEFSTILFFKMNKHSMKQIQELVNILQRQTFLLYRSRNDAKY